MCSRNACRYMHIVYIPLYFFKREFFPCRDRACAGRSGVGLVWQAGAAVLPLPLWCSFFFPRVFLLSFTYLVSLRVMHCFFFFLLFRSVFDNIPLCRTLRVSPIERAWKVWAMRGHGGRRVLIPLLSPGFFFRVAVTYLPYFVHLLVVIPCAPPLERACARCVGVAGGG